MLGGGTERSHWLQPVRPETRLTVSFRLDRLPLHSLNVVCVVAAIDLCAEGKHNCEQICVGSPGSFTCDCNQGYKLNDDKKTCSSQSRSQHVTRHTVAHYMSTADGLWLCAKVGSDFLTLLVPLLFSLLICEAGLHDVSLLKFSCAVDIPSASSCLKVLQLKNSEDT